MRSYKILTAFEASTLLKILLILLILLVIRLTFLILTNRITIEGAGSSTILIIMASSFLIFTTEINESWLNEITQLVETTEGIITTKNINTFEKEKVLNKLEASLNIAKKLSKDNEEISFINFLMKNYDLYEFLRNKNLTKEEKEYKEKLIAFIVKADNKASDILGIN